MAHFLQMTYLDPFAARNVAPAPRAESRTRVEHAQHVSSLAPGSGEGNIDWWVTHYEAAGRALMAALD